MRIALVCGAPSSEHLAPFNDPEWEIWVLGNRLDRHKGRRVTRIFEIHDDLSEHGDGKRYAEWLVSHGIQMTVGRGFPAGGPNVERFPFDEAEGLFGSTYLTSSTAYMMALAILKGATEIGVYGSDMSVDDHEYFWQRPCLEAWIGFAKGRGIKVTIPEVSPIGRCEYVEGAGSGGKPEFAKPPFTQTGFAAMAQAHQQSIDKLLAEIKERQNLIATHSGAQQAYERLAKVARAVEAGIDVKSLTDTARIK